jgi:nitrite reductase/ring-hydroxylating ferredoxin subunit
MAADVQRPAPPQKFVVAKVSDIPPGERLLVEVGGREIGIFNTDGEFSAMLNRCPHLGGPLCEGPIMDLVLSDGPGDMRIDRSRKMLMCPWHAWEFDVRTGQSYVDPRRMRARQYKVEVATGEEVCDGPVEGPFVAEMVSVAVEDDYVVVSIRPGAGGPESRAVRGTWQRPTTNDAGA